MSLVHFDLSFASNFFAPCFVSKDYYRAIAAFAARDFSARTALTRNRRPSIDAAVLRRISVKAQL
jgi:hypothetical protein